VKSALYECRIVHRRLAPTRHCFAYNIFFLALDLRRLSNEAKQLRSFSTNRWNIYSFRPQDYLPFSDKNGAETVESLSGRVERFGVENGIDLRGCEIELLTLPRVFGYAFNPVSFYFCRDANGEPRGAIVEVTNTFREIKPYWLGPEHFRAAAFRRRVPKHFYVSPFSDVDVEFQFSLRPPGEKLAIEIDDYIEGERTLASTLQGRRKALSDARLLWYLVKYPAITTKVITLIHWHALKLYLKRTPWYRKTARASDQRDLLHAHASIRPKSSS